ncbi:MAG: Txe/YoeB family addiction module toxin [Paludibacteraceae bacterium]|nr:Txe/YoeB family addiction module toxin [Paludibacteraceae bacterium]
MYEIKYSKQANMDLAKLLENEPKAFQKAVKLLDELREHPKTGTGHPEPLKGKPENRWSRQITKKHRLVYRIFETEVYVDILSSYGHYEDK